MIIAFRFNETDANFTAILDMMTLARENGIAFDIVANNKTSQIKPYLDTPTRVSTPTAEVKAHKPLSEAKDVELPVTVVDGGLTIGYGAGRAGAKMLVKSVGFKWDENKRAYVGGDLKALKLKGRGQNRTLTVTADWVQKGRDKAAEKAAKRG